MLMPYFLALAAFVAIFAWIFRKVDAHAPIMISGILTLWGLEILAKAHLGPEWRSLLPLTDLAGAILAYWLGYNRPRDWIRIVYQSLVAACALHVLYHFNAIDEYRYVVALNVLFLVRLATILTPGVSYVWQALGDYMFRSGLGGPRMAPALFQTRRR